MGAHGDVQCSLGTPGKVLGDLCVPDRMKASLGPFKIMEGGVVGPPGTPEKVERTKLPPKYFNRVMRASKEMLRISGKVLGLW